MIVSGTRLLLNLFEAYHRRVNYVHTTTGGITEDETTLPTLQVAKPSWARGRWVDTTVLTDFDPAIGISDTDADTDATMSRRHDIYRLGDLYGPRELDESWRGSDREGSEGKPW